jgi:hypothetical protein
MATPTPTIRPITTTFASCVAEREPAGDEVFGFHALWRAYQACRRGKRNTRDTQRYEARLLDRLAETRTALESHAWRPSRPLTFIVFSPKLREIHAAPFADRVVHHLLSERLTRIYEPLFIHDSCANRLGKGTHFAVDRLQGFMRQAGHGGTRPAYALQLDIANFFNRIHRPTLFGLLQQRLVRAVRRQGLAPEEARGLQAHCRALLEADPAAGVRRKGAASRFEQVPPHKRLAAQEAGRGLPVGNLTSQFFANVYLNELDQFVKHTLKARWYVRYVDDFVLLHPDPAQLLAWRAQIAAFLEARLHLRLKALSEPRQVTDGVDFLGYVIRPRYKLARRRVVRRFNAVLQAFEHAHVRPNALRLPPAARDLLRARVASYLAHLGRASSWHLWQRTLRRFPWLGQVFDDPESALQGAALKPAPLKPAWEPRGVSGLAGQYRAIARRHAGACVLMQVGARWLASGAHLGLLARQPGAVVVRRPGLGACVELPPQYLAPVRNKLKRAGIAHVLAAQGGHFKSGFKRRSVVLVWHPANPHSPTSPSSSSRGAS